MISLLNFLFQSSLFSLFDEPSVVVLDDYLNFLHMSRHKRFAISITPLFLYHSSACFNSLTLYFIK